MSAPHPLTLTACLIVKDEADNLPRCLKSLQGFVDEIVVVDTGSRDATVSIAESFGAKVAHFAWCDDFAAARNASLDLASSAWVLVIDADEVLQVADAAAWRRRLEAPKAYTLLIENVEADGRTGSRFLSSPRLFPNRPALRFQGRLHEDVYAALDAEGLSVAPAEGVSLRHHGYDADALASGAKHARNVALARRMADEAPERPQAWLHLASSCFLAGEPAQAQAAIARVHALAATGSRLTGEALRAFRLLETRCQLAAGQERAALETLGEGLVDFPGYPEYHFERGALRGRLGDVAGATADFEACLAAQSGRWFSVRAGVTGYLAHLELANLWLARQEQGRAAQHLHAAGQDSDCPPAEAAQMTALAAQLAPPPVPASRPSPQSDARRRLFARLEADPRDAEAFLALGFDFFQTGEHDKAMLALAQSLRLNAEPAASYHLLGLVLDALGQPGLAEKAFAQALALDPDHPTARDCRLAVRAKRPQHEPSAELREAVEGLLALGRPTVSACLIVKDEAENLPRCLESLKGWVDEIVVVDTGSSDETVSIAESFGCKVGHFAWCDDFSAARNAALAMASSDWVLVIDADEEFEVLDVAAWRGLLSDRTHVGFVLRLTDVDDLGQERADTRVFRFFRNRPELRFTGRIHESLNEGVARTGLPVVDSPAARFRHHGYAESALSGRDKGRRNAHLAERQVADAPADPMAWLHLARAYTQAGRHAEALEAYRALDAMPGGLASLPRHTWIMQLNARVELLRLMNLAAEAESTLSEALAQFPAFPEFHYQRGELRFTRGDMAGARLDFEACLTPDPTHLPLISARGVTDVLPRQMLDAIARQSGATPAGPGTTPPSLDTALARIAAGDPPGATAELLAYLEQHPRSADGFVLLGEIFLALDSLDKALLATGQSIRLHATARAFDLLGRTLEALGQAPMASRAYRLALQLDADHPQAMMHLLACRGQAAAHAPDAAMEAAVEGLLALARPSVSACLIVKDEAENLPRCLESLKGWVDEIVVVDTGSSDATVSIAELFGCKVGHFAWCDDFAAARNASLAMATSDWVLVIDADETLAVESPEAWSWAIRDRQPGGYVLPQHNMIDGRLDSQTPTLRLFQRLDGLGFERRLHETLAPALARLGLSSAPLTGITLLHHGYGPQAMTEHAKGARNMRVARLEAEERPNDAIALFNLARSLTFSQATLPEAIEVYERLGQSELRSQLPATLLACYFLDVSRVYNSSGRKDESLAALDEGLSCFPGYAMFHYERAQRRYERGDLTGAVDDFRACLADQSPSAGLISAPDVTDALPRRALAELAAAHPALRAQIEGLGAAAVRPSVSACLIVKDEAENLPRCLESLKGWVDEIVVVDTGSSDETVSIAEAHGCKVGHFTWCNDFSAARNAALAMATSDWVLVIDADEALQVDDTTAFREALAAEHHAAYLLMVHNAKSDGGRHSYRLPRLFKRDERVRYSGRLHEDVAPAMQALGWQPALLDAAAILHDGYLDEVVRARGKWERNLAIAMAEAEASPMSANAWYNLGRTSLYLGQRATSLEVFARVATLLASGSPLGEGPYCDYLVLHQRLLAEQGNTEDALALLAQGLQRVPGFPEFLYERAQLHTAAGRLAEARADYAACLAAHGRFFIASMRPGITDRLPHEALAALATPR